MSFLLLSYNYKIMKYLFYLFIRIFNYEKFFSWTSFPLSSFPNFLFLLSPPSVLSLQVIQVKDWKDHQLEPDSNYVTLQVGAGLKKWKNLTRAELGHFAHKGLDPKAHLTEFRYATDLFFPARNYLFTIYL